MIRNFVITAAAVLSSSQLFAATVQSVITPYGAALAEDQLVLQNDSFVEGGGQAYLQMGFVAKERAGVWLQVPAEVPYFKVDSFRVLLGSASEAFSMVPSEMFSQIFFQMGIAQAPSSGIPADIENAADITPGPYWNDIPAIGDPRQLGCARGGEFVGAALEFTHTGLPSVYRDLDGINPKHNTLYAVPGGWNYSVAYGLRGDWILRVVGHAATAAECGA